MTDPTNDEIPENEDKPDHDGKNVSDSPSSEMSADSLKSKEENDEEELDADDIKNELLAFSELDGDVFTDQDFLDMEEAISENLADEEDLLDDSEEIEGEPSEEGKNFKEGESLTIEAEPFTPEIDDDLEVKMQAEIQKKKKEQGIKTVSKEKFIKNLSNRRNKIVYHALWHLTFNIEDHEATKQTLYEALKGVTSKNPVEPLEEHKFYFGLGFILRLKLYDEKVVKFTKGKLKLMVNPEHLQEILSMIGDPISDRPILTKTEKKQMFQDFLQDDFLDI